MTPYEIIHEVRKQGWLLLLVNGRLHVELPAGHEGLLAELRAQRVQVRAILRDLQNATRPRRAPRQAPPPPQPPQSRYTSRQRAGAANTLSPRPCDRTSADDPTHAGRQVVCAVERDSYREEDQR